MWRDEEHLLFNVATGTQGLLGQEDGVPQNQTSYSRDSIKTFLEESTLSTYRITNEVPGVVARDFQISVPVPHSN